MTKLLDEAIARIRALPEARQDDAAAILTELASQDSATIGLTERQKAEVARRMAGPPDHASEAEVHAVFSRYLSPEA